MSSNDLTLPDVTLNLMKIRVFVFDAHAEFDFSVKSQFTRGSQKKPKSFILYNLLI